MEPRGAIKASPLRASVRALPRLSRRTGFWAVAFSFLAVTAFSTAPSSLYGLYEHQDHLSSLTITFVYAVYAVGIVVSLLLAGHVSDWYDRRAVLLPALVVAVVAAVVFLVWRSLAGLLVARVLTGLALGAAVATATAFVTDLDAGPGGVATRRAGIVATIANIGGLGVGPLIAGLLAPTRRVRSRSRSSSFSLSWFGPRSSCSWLRKGMQPFIRGRGITLSDSRRRPTHVDSSSRPRPELSPPSRFLACSPDWQERFWRGPCTTPHQRWQG